MSVSFDPKAHKVKFDVTRRALRCRPAGSDSGIGGMQFVRCRRGGTPAPRALGWGHRADAEIELCDRRGRPGGAREGIVKMMAKRMEKA